MNVKEKNGLLLAGKTHVHGLFPQLEGLIQYPITFDSEFGLNELPNEPGLIMIRGARQIGKSTWLEQELKSTIEKTGAGSAIYLNGDELLNADALALEIKSYLPLLSKSTQIVPRIFIDEITAVSNWERAIKYLYDSGETRHVLIVTTGSKAIDLRHGTERLPGRKGRLSRSNFLFTPVSFKQFYNICADKITGDPVIAYMLTGGNPRAINEFVLNQRIPKYLFELVKDWILGECAAQGRSRNLLTWIFQQLILRGGSSVPLNNLARDSGVANNTVVHGYIELLQDLLCISTSYCIDPNNDRPLVRKPRKYHFINSIAALAFFHQEIATIKDFETLLPNEQGKWYEWIVAQELWRRAAIRGEDQPELMFHFQSSSHQLDFKLSNQDWLAVKRGHFNPADFVWMPQVFPKSNLTVFSSDNAHVGFITSVSFRNFLLDNQHQSNNP